MPLAFIPPTLHPSPFTLMLISVKLGGSLPFAFASPTSLLPYTYLTPMPNACTSEVGWLTASCIRTSYLTPTLHHLPQCLYQLSWVAHCLLHRRPLALPHSYLTPTIHQLPQCLSQRSEVAHCLLHSHPLPHSYLTPTSECLSQ